MSPTALFLVSNISVIAYHPALYPHLKAQLTAERFKAFYAGVVKGKVTRFEVWIKRRVVGDYGNIRYEEQRGRRHESVATPPIAGVFRTSNAWG